MKPTSLKPHLAAFISFLILASQCSATLIPPFFVDCVVALGCTANSAAPGLPPDPKWQTEGTGFFYGRLVQDDPDPLKRNYAIYLVTAKHVVQGHPPVLGELHVRLNSKNTSASVQEFALSQAPGGGWFFHPDPSVDIAVISVDFHFLEKQGLVGNFFSGDTHAADRKTLREMEVSAGDGIFVLGFPMNLAGVQKNYVIVRQGSIARISEMLDGGSKSFMLDSFVFPGNSGGPVILRPEINAIQNTKHNLRATLIGIVTSYRPYEDVAASEQTHQRRIVFQENSGLAEALPIDFVDETIDLHRKANGASLSTSERKIGAK